MEHTQGNTPSDNSVPGKVPGDMPQGAAGPGRDGCRHNGRHGRRGGRFFFVIAVALLAGIAGGYIGKSFAHGHGVMGLSGDPAKMDERVERMVKRFASKVDATPEQQQKLSVIAKAAAKDIGPVRDRLRDARKQAMELARAPVIDRAALEKLRADQLQLADTVSRRMTQALADAAEVLTPEQRQKIAGRWAERMERRERGWGRG